MCVTATCAQCVWFVLGMCGSGEACWWTVHPASRQRSEGEKVRAGDDLILVSVSSERYLVSQARRVNVFLLSLLCVLES